MYNCQFFPGKTDLEGLNPYPQLVACLKHSLEGCMCRCFTLKKDWMGGVWGRVRLLPSSPHPFHPMYILFLVD